MNRNRISFALALIAAVTLVAAAPIEPMTLHSDTFVAGAPMPSRVAYSKCGGENASPQMSWRNVPNGATQFALIEHDADAPVAGGFYHWIFYGLPATARSLRADTPRPSGAIIGTTSANLSGVSARGYFGACPPPGPMHHYTFTLYALDAGFRAGPQTSFTGPELERHMRGHILAQATLVGTYRR